MNNAVFKVFAEGNTERSDKEQTLALNHSLFIIHQQSPKGFREP